MEAGRRIVELEARVATLQDELAVQQQNMQAQWQHYKESIGKMEVPWKCHIGYYSNGLSRRCRACGLSMHNSWSDKHNPCEICCRRGL